CLEPSLSPSIFPHQSFLSSATEQPTPPATAPEPAAAHAPWCLRPFAAAADSASLLLHPSSLQQPAAACSPFSAPPLFCNQILQLQR
ncbi:hypothetical protein SLEP1_g60475, partial [Rubroshorea leprosula]